MLERQFKVLLIEDNPGDARLMREYLAAAHSGMFHLEWADTLAGGLDLCPEAEVDLIVLDLGLPDSGGLDTFLRVRERAPAVPVVILTGLNDEATAIEALARGAQDYIVKGELKGPALVRAIRYAIERDRIVRSGRPRGTRRARVLAFAGAKGGVGTSTVATNIALALLAAGRSVVLAEIRPWPGDLACRLFSEGGSETQGPENGGEVAEVLEGVRLCRGPSGLPVLLGPQDATAEGALPAQVTASLRAIQREAEYLVLDFVPYPPALAREVLALCDYLAIVSEPETVSLACAKRLAEAIGGWAIARDRIGLVAVSRSAGAAPEAGDVRDLSGCEVIGIVPSASELSVSPDPRTPVVAARPESECARALVELASRLAGDPVISPFV